MSENHLLLKHGILKEFSIRQIVPSKQLQETCRKIANSSKTKKEFDKKIKKYLMDINPNIIPGTIPLSEGELKNNKLNIITHNILNYFINQNIPTEEVLMVLNAIAYVMEHKTIPYFEFYNESGKSNDLDSDENID